MYSACPHEERCRVNKVTIGAIPYLAPIPIVRVGVDVDGRPNFATAGERIGTGTESGRALASRLAGA